ncbi:stAR-related lipid transfer protein 5-like isoform X3 [Nycticebus coucang]|uniref:stAR-related lipid transfer protein 5-like isoform X3 n=1 Tax=Nycticebus coucang TaxID=9470 RepID=UPI00234DF4C7|nr:stAR-related lipid transfer protein 5-like isoform X3 [Nycticebus coucang]
MEFQFPGGHLWSFQATCKCMPCSKLIKDASSCLVFLYRGEGIVLGTPKEVWDCVKPAAGGLREKWDENVASFEIIQSITDTLCISRTSTPSAAMKLISPRDFVDLVLVRKYEDGTISSNATHVEHPLSPPKPGFVRGFNHPCGCFCEPLPGCIRNLYQPPQSVCCSVTRHTSCWSQTRVDGEQHLFVSPGAWRRGNSLKAFAE